LEKSVVNQQLIEEGSDEKGSGSKERTHGGLDMLGILVFAPGIYATANAFDVITPHEVEGTDLVRANANHTKFAHLF